MKELGVPLDELSQSRLMIQGFNRDRQRALEKVRLELFIDDMESNALFHVIDAKTTYNMLLGRPWIHQNGVVSSTLHQCFKYYRNGKVKTVVIDTKPFTMAEAHYADAKFYLKDAPIEDAQSAPNIEQQLKQKGKKVAFEKEEKITKGLKDFTLPLTSLEGSKISKPPLEGFVRPLKAPMVEHDNLPTQRANHFDPNAYRLLVKAGYKQEDVAKLVQEPSEPTDMAAQKSTKANKVWLKNTDSAKPTRPRLGFPPLKLKINREASRHITAEEVNEEEKIQVEPPKPSIFN